MTELNHNLNSHELGRLLAGETALLARLNDPSAIRALKLALASEALCAELASDVARVQNGTLRDRLVAWWQGAGLPAAFAAAAIAAVAIGALNIRAPESTQMPAMVSTPASDDLFVAAFEQSDQMFGGEFEPGNTASDQMFNGSFDG